MLPRVLIAEPDDDLRTTYERYLSRQGFTVAMASTLDECLSQMVAFAPDAIVCELDFPDGPLDERLDSLLATAGGRKPAVFLATRRSQDRTSAKVRSMVEGYFVKPFSMLGLAAGLREAAGAPPPLPPK